MDLKIICNTGKMNKTAVEYENELVNAIEHNNLRALVSICIFSAIVVYVSLASLSLCFYFFMGCTIFYSFCLSSVFTFVFFLILLYVRIPEIRTKSGDINAKALASVNTKYEKQFKIMDALGTGVVQGVIFMPMDDKQNITTEFTIKNNNQVSLIRVTSVLNPKSEEKYKNHIIYDVNRQTVSYYHSDNIPIYELVEVSQVEFYIES